MDHFFLFLRINQTFTNNKKLYMILLRFPMLYLDYENIFGWICRRKNINHIPRDKPQTLEVFNQFHWQPCATNVENLKLMLTIRICDEFKYCKSNQASAWSQEMWSQIRTEQYCWVSCFDKPYNGIIFFFVVDWKYFWFKLLICRETLAKAEFKLVEEKINKIDHPN